jgi:hypothetical protein
MAEEERPRVAEGPQEFSGDFINARGASGGMPTEQPEKFKGVIAEFLTPK